MTFTAIFTGSRNYPRDKAYHVSYKLRDIYDEHKGDIFIRVGDCPTGVDEYVVTWCGRNLRADQFQIFKANWQKYGTGAGPVRNKKMVDSGADICIAFPEDNSRGTKNCVELAYKSKIKVEFPDLPKWAQWAAPIATFGGI